MNTQRGFISLAAIIGIIALVLVGGGAWYVTHPKVEVVVDPVPDAIQQEKNSTTN